MDLIKISYQRWKDTTFLGISDTDLGKAMTSDSDTRGSMFGTKLWTSAPYFGTKFDWNVKELPYKRITVCRSWWLVPKLMKFLKICAEVLVPKFTRAEVRLPVWISQHDKGTTFGATKATMQRSFKSKCNEPSRRWLRWFDVKNRSYYFQIKFNCYYVTIASKNLHWIKNWILVYNRNYTIGKLHCSSVTCSLILFITWISWSDRLGNISWKYRARLDSHNTRTR